MIQFNRGKEYFVHPVHAKYEGDIDSGEAQPKSEILWQLFLYKNLCQIIAL